MPAILALAIWALALLAPVCAFANVTTLSKVRQVLDLSPAQAQSALPVSLRGVVTYVDFPANHPWMLFVQDETAGIFVAGHAPPLQAGDVVEVSGWSDPGEFAPRVRNTKVWVAGHGVMPHAEFKSYEEVMNGSQDCQWIAARGIVHSAHFNPERPDQLVLELACGPGRITAKILTASSAEISLLPDAVVTVRGVCTTLFNRRRQLLGVEIYTTGLTNVTVEKAAPAHPFSMAESPATNLMQFSRGADFGHRVKVCGVVTFERSNHFLYLRGKSGALLAESDDTEGAWVGDTVEVLGFPAPGDFSAVLHDSVCRLVAHGEPPAPRPAEVEKILTGAYDADLICVKGKVLDATLTAEQQVLTVQSSNVVFTAMLDRARSQPGLFEKGSLLLLTGICRMPPGSQLDQPKTFNLKLRAAADVTILAEPPWWTLPRMIATAGAAVALALITSAWCIVVSRKNSLLREHRRIQQEILEISGREQQRIGQDLHDGVCQQMGAIGFMLKMLEEELEPTAASHAAAARKIASHLHRAIDQTRAVARGLFPVRLEENGLESALEELAAQTSRVYRLPCRFECSNAIAVRDNGVALDLYRIAQEAVNNAIKHGQPSQIEIRLVRQNGTVRLSVENDGRRFEGDAPGRGMGLHIMHYRAQRIGAEMQIGSGPETGCRVICSLHVHSNIHGHENRS